VGEGLIGRLEDFKIERFASTLSTIIKPENLTFSQSFDIPIVSSFEIPKSFLILAVANRDLSSVGLERCFDRAEVMGSNPLGPTFLDYEKQEVRN